jgi:DhnA family fructose-bisphosphate aldolase class Ia
MGKIRRMQRIFAPDGKAIVTAMDHGGTSGPMPGIVDIGKTIDTVVSAGTDAIICNIGVAKHYEEHFGPAGLIVRMDFPYTDFSMSRHDGELYLTVEEAVRAGADGVIFSGGPDVMNESPELEKAMMNSLTKLARACEKYGMPLIAEMYPGGWNPPAGAINVKSLKISARLAAEWGADALKMPYVKGYEEVVNGTWLPILILGGEKTDKEETFFQGIYDAIQVGVKGVAIGRNIFGHENPAAVVALLDDIIHKGETVENAMKRLK